MMNRTVKASVFATLCLGLAALTSCCGSRCQEPCQPIPCQQGPCQQGPSYPNQPSCAPYSPCAMPEPCMMEPAPMMATPSEPAPFDTACGCKDKPPVPKELSFMPSCECPAAPVTHVHPEMAQSEMDQSEMAPQGMCEQSICGHCMILPAPEDFEPKAETAQVENPQDMFMSQE